MKEFHSAKAEMAWLAIRREDHDGALSLAGDILAQDPEDVEGLLIAAICYLALKDADRTEATIRSLLAMAPENPQAHLVLGLYLDDLRGERIGAERAFRSAIRLDPEGADSYAVLGQFLAKHGRCQEGITVARQGLKLDPENLTLLRTLQTLYRFSEDFELAEEFEQRALQQDPEDALPHLEAGLRLLNQQKPREAKSRLLSSLQLQPDTGETFDVIAHEKVRSHPFFKNGIFLPAKPGVVIFALLSPVLWWGLSFLFSPFRYLAWIALVVVCLAYLYSGLFWLCCRICRRRIDRGRL